MKIQFKILITLGLVFSVLFGSFTHTNASENSALQKNLSKHFKLTNDSKFIVSDPSDTTRDINFSRIVTSSPVHMGVFKQTTVQVDGSLTYTIVALSLQSFKFFMTNVNLENNELTDWTEREYSISDLNSESREVVVNGITFYYSSVTVTTKQILDSDLNVYSTNLDYNDFLGRLFALLMGDNLNLDSDYVVAPDFLDGTYDSSLDFINLSYKQLYGVPKSHQIYWDENTNYDSNTWVTIECDIKWRPFLGALNQVSGWSYVTQGELLANTNNFTCLVTEPWKKYFEVNDIDWSVFGTQWVDCFYLQVIKYHPDTDTWTKSNVWFVDTGVQTTGQSTIPGDLKAVIGTAEKNLDTGEYDKTKDYIVDGNGNVVSGVIDDVYDELEDVEVSDIPSYLAALSKAFLTGFKSLQSSLGEIPAMISSVISFLPETIVTLIGFGIVIAILLRVIGR